MFVASREVNFYYFLASDALFISLLHKYLIMKAGKLFLIPSSLSEESLYQPDQQTLDHACRQQQVNDGCFPTLSAVPTHALTVTIPTFRRALALSVVVPGPRKAAAVRATMHDPIAIACPATILRTHPRARLFVDHASASQLD